MALLPTSRTGSETLERYQRTVRYAPLLALAIFFVTIAIVSIAVSAKMPQDELLLLVSILLGTGVLVALILRIVFNKQLAGVQNALHLLQTAQPRRMRMRFTGVFTLGGLLVKLWDTQPGEPTPDFSLASVRTTSKKHGSSKEMIPVKAFFSPLSDQALVLEVDSTYTSSKKFFKSTLAPGNVFWGRLCRPRDLAALKKNMRLFLLGLTLFCLVFIAFLAWLSERSVDQGKYNLALAQESESWPDAPGVITGSRVTRVTIKRGKSRVPGYEAQIAYSYEVGGRTYHNTLIYSGYKASRYPERAQELVAHYPNGARVRVRYHPDGPALAVLEPGHVRWNRHRLEKAEQDMKIALSTSSLILLLPLVLYVVFSRRYNSLIKEVRHTTGLRL